MARSNSRPKAADASSALFGADDTIDLLSVFGVLRRRKWLIAAVCCVGTGIAAAIGVQLTPTYTAKALVMLEPRESRVLDVEAVLAGLPPDAAVIATQVGLLQSRTFLSRVMDDLKLFDDPEFNVALRQEGAATGPFAGLPEPVSNLLGALPNEWLIATGLAEEQQPTLESEAPRLGRETAVGNFLKGLAVGNETGSYLISVAYTSEDPAKSARVANRIAETYVSDQLTSKLSATGKASGFLEERIGPLREEVRRAEEAVAQFRSKNGLLDTQGVTLGDQELSSLNAEGHHRAGRSGGQAGEVGPRA
jgi:uncharacterized protein involved in exopolysaccharide biosynthesis